MENWPHRSELIHHTYMAFQAVITFCPCPVEELDTGAPQPSAHEHGAEGRPEVVVSPVAMESQVEELGTRQGSHRQAAACAGMWAEQAGRVWDRVV